MPGSDEATIYFASKPAGPATAAFCEKTSKSLTFWGRLKSARLVSFEEQLDPALLRDEQAIDYDCIASRTASADIPTC